MSNTIAFQMRYEPSIHKVPFHVLVVYSSLFCSGALVSSRVVLTTASCFLARQPGTKVFAKLGSDTILTLSQIIPVIKIKVHEYYNYPGRLANDIALLLLETHVTFIDEKVAKAILARPQDSLHKNEILTVSSWTKSDIKSDYESFLVQLRLVVMGTEQCRGALGALGHHSNFCAQYRGYNMFAHTARRRSNRASSNGEYQDHLPHDSGSPGVSDNHLISGVLSFVLYDDIMYNIGVFTNISYFYRWIMVNTKNLQMLQCSLKNSTNNNQIDIYHVKLYNVQ